MKIFLTISIYISSLIFAFIVETDTITIVKELGFPVVIALGGAYVVYVMLGGLLNEIKEQNKWMRESFSEHKLAIEKNQLATEANTAQMRIMSDEARQNREEMKNIANLMRK